LGKGDRGEDSKHNPLVQDNHERIEEEDPMFSLNHPRNTIRKYRAVLIGLALFTLVLPACLLSGCDAGKPKVYRVGILYDGVGPFDAMGDGFRAKMTALGYIEGRNIVYDLQNVGLLDPDVARRKAEKLLDDKVDLIFAFATPAAIAAREATQRTNTPVVFAYVQLEGTTLVKSIREPGGNMTGVRYPLSEFMSRRLELLNEMAPQARRVWVGYEKSGENNATALEALRPAASSIGITLVEVPVATEEEFGADLAARARSADLGLDAILTLPDRLNTSISGFAILSKFASEHHVPLAGGLDSQVQTALFVNGADFRNVGELAAPLADKILKGTPAGTIPIVTPNQTLVINAKVAQELKLLVPEGLLRQADRIIR
jgi:putative tryptophan/tyrosine transport system substrate-binding protein